MRVCTCFDKGDTRARTLSLTEKEIARGRGNVSALRAYCFGWAPICGRVDGEARLI